MTRGFVYSVSGETFIEEAISSAQRAKEVMPDIPITMYADRPVRVDAVDAVHVWDAYEYDRGDSILEPEMCPYERNVFLDSDTYIARPVTDLFRALERYPLLITHSPGRVPVDGVPACIPEYNTGVIGYRRSPDVKECFRTWRTLFEKQRAETGETRNQGPFTRALWESDLPALVVPREYNVRVPRAAYLNGDAKIIHGRHWDSLETVAERLNQDTSRRVYYRDEFIGPSDTQIIDAKGIPRLLRDAVTDYGVLGAARAAWRTIR